ncbi:hypothetical protein [Pseudomonas sp. Irchel s3a18]|uniref:hypothetical protein n=1 Tax=Pseudomonas sp. Irchel s3a18 TaxID=2009053 RepID=UPI000F993A79|nr:hypothetical protein [Pseudomonas sp. Irchel s3a18]
MLINTGHRERVREHVIHTAGVSDGGLHLSGGSDDLSSLSFGDYLQARHMMLGRQGL